MNRNKSRSGDIIYFKMYFKKVFPAVYFESLDQQLIDVIELTCK